jgi:ribosomal protein S18 acetylase RimI-like enzyme
MLIRRTKIEDITEIYKMYCLVAAVPGGLARLEHELSEQYIKTFVEKSLAGGVTLVAENPDGNIVGEIHAYCSGLFCFSHVLTDLTVAVDPNYRNQGIARSLFGAFFEEVEKKLPHISRVELISRESNIIAIQFYESLGFKKEGRLENRIKNADGSLEADIPMGWTKFAF